MAKLQVTLEGIAKARPSIKGWEPEMERRFLVEAFPFRTDDFPGTRSSYPHLPIVQFYVKNDGAEYDKFRLRRIGNSFFASVKRGKGLFREEKKWEILEYEFRALMRGVEWPRVKKTRYYLEWEGENIELDVFHRHNGSNLKGLVIAEVEFSSLRRAEMFEVPEWFGTEITWKKGYGNGSFAKRGMPDAIRLLR